MIKFTYTAYHVAIKNTLEQIYMKTSKEPLNNPQENNVEYESIKFPELDAMGREKFWEDIGRPND